MKKHILRIRKVDKFVFDSIKENKKTIETRAATNKLKKIEVGDFLIFICNNEKLEKEVKKVKLYKTIDQMVKEIDFKKIMPFVDSIDEMKKVYFSFPNYKEKIEKFGLIIFKMK